MKNPIDAVDCLISKAGGDSDFRERLLAKPIETIEEELGVKLDRDHEIHVHEETYDETHVVLPPKDKFSEAEREAARTGAESLEFLRETLYDPAPPARPSVPERADTWKHATSKALVEAGRDSIKRGLEFLESTIDEQGAWHCIRFNVADPNIPRHFERPAFVSAFCALALECSNEPRAKAMYSAAKAYIISTMEYPGLWRYYRHLPLDLDSTTLCSLVIGEHPWIFLGKNVPQILANRDDEGCFMTWVHAEGEPDVVSSFRIEADPVVNANVIAYLGDHPETKNAQRWLESLITDGDLEGSSKWYPDTVMVYYATTRAMIRAKPALDRLRPILVDQILGLCDENGQFDNILQSAQAISALDNLGSLGSIDVKSQVERLINSQRDDGSWPEILAFGDQLLKWGVVGQIGHKSESVTSVFCVEALERLVEYLND